MAKPKKNVAEQKPSDAESYMTIDMGGKERRVDRLDMTDAEWAATKKTAIDKGIFKFAHDREAVETKTEPLQDGKTYQNPLAEKKAAAVTEDKAPAQDPNEMIEISDAKGNKYTVKRSNADKLDLSKLEEQSKNVQDGTGGGTGTLGGKIRSVAAKLFEGASPDQAQKDRELVDSIQLPPTPAAKPSGTSKMRAMMSQEMAADASKPAPAPPPAPTTPVEAAPPAPAPQSQGFDIMPTVKLAGNALSDAGGWLARNLAPGDAPNMGQPPPAAPAAPTYPEKDRVSAEPNMLVDPPLAANAGNTVSPTGAAPTKIAGAPTNSAGGSARVSMSSKGVPDPSMPPLVDRRAELSAATDAHNAAQMAKAQSEAEGLRSEADVMRKGLREVTDMELERRQADKVAQDHVREAQAAYTKTVESMKAPEKIDPDRWWSSRNTAQKIFAVMSAGLTRGATLGMFQDAIARDIQVQQHDIQNSRLAAGQKADAQHNVYQMARQNGLDERAAYLTAESNAWDNIERSSKLAAMSSKAPSVIAAAQEQAALANQQKIEKLAQLDGHLETQGIERKKLFLENRKLDILAMKKSGSGGPKAGKQLPAHQTEALGDLEASLAQTKKLAKDFGHPGLFESLWDKARGTVDPTGPQARFNKRVKALIQNIGPGMGSGVLNASDLKRWDDLAAKAGTIGGDTAWESLVEEIEAKLKSRKKSFGQAGFNMTGYDNGTPDESSGMSDEDAYGMLTGEAF